MAGPARTGLTGLAARVGIGFTAATIFVSAVAAPPADAPGTPPADELATEAEKPRVVIRVNRNETARGYVEHETDDVIVLSWKGEIKSFAKSRISHITRLVTPEPGQQGTIVLNDGTVRAGVLILEDNFDFVLFEVEGIRGKLHRDAVDHVELKATFEERYERFKSSLEPGSYDHWYTLCQWLAIDEKRYDLARDELLQLLSETEHFEATRLLATVEAQLRLERQAQENDEGVLPTLPADPADTDRPADPRFDHLITDEDVNLIRVFEIDFANPPRLEISPDTIRKLIDGYGTSEWIPATPEGRRALYRRDPIDIARMMFALRARDLYGEINVLNEPEALNDFRRTVHDRWLIRNCATSRCHGGEDAGRFFLHRRRHSDPRVRYTNLLILERTNLGGEWPLVNYEDPTMSLIIQHALPRNIARLPHPPVAGWKPSITRSGERMAQDAIEWMRSMYQPRPTYPVDFEPIVPDVAGEAPGDQEGGRVDR